MGASVHLKDIPINKWIKKAGQENLALYGGDDYQTNINCLKKDEI